MPRGGATRRFGPSCRIGGDLDRVIEDRRVPPRGGQRRPRRDASRVIPRWVVRLACQAAPCTWRALFRDASCSGQQRPTAETTLVRRWCIWKALDELFAIKQHPPRFYLLLSIS